MCNKLAMSLLWVFLIIGSLVSESVQYTSEEINENSKSFNSAFSSAVGTSETNRQVHRRFHDPPNPAYPVACGRNPTAPCSTNYNDQSAAGFNSPPSQLLSGGQSGSASETNILNRPIGYGPFYRHNVPSLDPAVTGAGNFDVRVDASPSKANTNTPNTPVGYNLPTGYAPNLSGGNTAPHQPYGSHHSSAPPLTGLGANYIEGMYDNQPNIQHPPPTPAPSYPAPPPPPQSSSYYPYPAHTGYSNSGQHSQLPHNIHNYPHKGGSESHLDHTFKMNTEYKEVGQHVGPFQGSNGYGHGYGSGYGGGYNGAFNRPFY